MRSIGEIEDAIKRFSPEMLTEFRAWCAEFDAELWDRQIERDVAAGKFDALPEEALAEHRAGLTKDLDPNRL